MGVACATVLLLMDDFQVYTFDGRIPVYQYGGFATRVDRVLTVYGIWSDNSQVFNNDQVFNFEMAFLKKNIRQPYGRVRVVRNIAVAQTPGCCCGPCMLSDGSVFNPPVVEQGCCVLSYLCMQQNTVTPTRRIWDYVCGYYGINIDGKVLQFLNEIRENVTSV